MSIVAVVRTRVPVWLRRYLPAEAAGTSAALTAAALAAASGAGVGGAVVAAAWAESAGFYTFVIAREHRRAGGRRGGLRAVGAAVREVVAEFGVAEVADTVFLR